MEKELITLRIFDTRSGQMHTLGSSTKKSNTVTVVDDTARIKSPMDYPDAYYCKTQEELKTTISWIMDHSEIYQETYNDDMLDDYIGSYEYLFKKN